MEKAASAPRPRPAPKPHALTLDNRQRAVLTGVSEVLAFDEGQVILMTEAGEVTLAGEGLHVTRLNLEEGQMAVEGKIDSIAYPPRGARRGWFRRNKG
ncbi:MAG: sporulation protein YabP [Clostridiales bacterium]|nr:sporulation protein YabP [Clostridiales bacterium]